MGFVEQHVWFQSFIKTKRLFFDKKLSRFKINHNNHHKRYKHFKRYKHIQFSLSKLFLTFLSLKQAIKMRKLKEKLKINLYVKQMEK